jgi:CDP-glycerol glycerophosphotransferase (TagB/SpsB family)
MKPKVHREVSRVWHQIIYIPWRNIIWLWKKWRRETDGTVFYMTSPMHYIMFANIHRYLPHTKIVAGSDKAAAFLKEQRIAYSEKHLYPDIVIMADYKAKQYPLFCVKNVQIYHGVGCKSYFYRKANKKYELYFAAGSYAARKLAERGINAIEIVGYPKTDAFFQGTLNRETILKNLDCDPARKTILYAPTWGEKSSAPVLCEVISKFSAKYNVIIKLHDHSPPAWRDIYKELPGVVLVDSPDATKFLYAADLLVSDFSSTVFEFAQLGRPIIAYGLTDTTLQELAADAALWQIVQRVNSEHTLKQHVYSMLENGWKPDTRFEETVNVLFRYRDGKAALRAAERIRELEEEVRGSSWMRSFWRRA